MSKKTDKKVDKETFLEPAFPVPPVGDEERKIDLSDQDNVERMARARDAMSGPPDAVQDELDARDPRARVYVVLQPEQMNPRELQDFVSAHRREATARAVAAQGTGRRVETVRLTTTATPLSVFVAQRLVGDLFGYAGTFATYEEAKRAAGPSGHPLQFEVKE